MRVATNLAEVMVNARLRAAEAVDVAGVHRDFDAATLGRAAREIFASNAGPGDALVVEPDGPVQKMTRTELLDLLQSNGLAALAAQVDRAIAPPGHVVGLVSGDSGARVRVFKVPPPVPARCEAFRLR